MLSPGLQAQKPLGTGAFVTHAGAEQASSCQQRLRTQQPRLCTWGSTGPAGACARGLSACYQARAPITPRAALSRWHGRTSARERPRGSRRRRGEPCVRAQPRGKASVRRAGLQSGRVWGGCVHAGGGVADEVLRGILRAGCDRLGSRQPG